MMLRMILRGLAAMALSVALAPTALLADAPAPMVPAADFDPALLLGDWYEVAGTPNRLEFDCHGTTVSVAKRSEDSRLDLKIACHKGSVDGKVLPIEGVMVQTDPGVFQVRFVRLTQLGNLDLMVLWQAADGSLAVLGSPTGDVGWIWAKSKTPDAAALEAAKAVLVKVGYVAEAIQPVDQGN